jgi:hypothetical protein
MNFKIYVPLCLVNPDVPIILINFLLQLGRSGNCLLNSSLSLLIMEKIPLDFLFNTRDNMLKWVRDESIKLGFVFVSTKSDCNSNRIKLILVLGCEEGGTV